MHRFFVRPQSIVGDRVTIRGAEAHHIAAVLRLRPGDRVIAFDGSMLERVVELDRVTHDEVAGRTIAVQRGYQSQVSVTLVQGVPKGAKLDSIIRMGTEVGVAQFIPIQARRTVPTGVRSRVDRWRRIALEAAKQSRRSEVPVVHAPMSLEDALELVAGSDLILVLWEGERTQTLAGALTRVPHVTRVAVVVGPEGGFDPAEVDTAVRAGAVSVSLGPLILRTDTAGVVAVSMILYEVLLRRQANSSALDQ